MKRILFAILLIAISGIYCQESMAQRETVPLSGDNWHYLPDEHDHGDGNGYCRGLPDSKIQVHVPHTWNVMSGLEDYVGKSWYERRIDIPKEWKNRRIYLKFNAIYRDAVIFVNGREAGRHTGSGYTMFRVDITDLVHCGENLMVVSVDNSFSENAIPYKKSFDWPADGGILRDVFIESVGVLSIDYLHVDASIYGETRLRFRLRNDSSESELKGNLTIKDLTGGKILHSGATSFVRMKNGEYGTELKLDNVRLWHFDNPSLYAATVSITGPDGVEDNVTVKYGYREIKIDGNRLYLNGEAVRVPGVEMMPGSNPDYGMAEPFSFTESTLKLLKESNCILTRFHWQQDSRLLDWLDEHGMLVQVEIPWWQQPLTLDEGLKATVMQQIDEMITEGYNHPCIIAWGLNNEVGRQDMTVSNEMLNYARSIDSARFVNIVNNRIFAMLESDPSLAGDIPTWNEYTGTWIGKAKEELPEHLDRIEEALGGRPLMITENGLCEPKFSGGDSTRISDMIYHYKEWSCRPWILGSIYFSLNDYRTHIGETGEGRFRQRHHGVIDAYNVPKKSYEVLKNLCSPLKIVSCDGKEAVLECSSSLPSYKVSGYCIKAGKRRIAIPDMLPGDRLSISLKRKTESFRILRPTGFSVCEWKRK